MGGYVINMGAIRRSTRGALFVAAVGSALLIGLGTANAQIGGAVRYPPASVGGCPSPATGEDGAPEHVAATDRTGRQRIKRATRPRHPARPPARITHTAADTKRELAERVPLSESVPQGATSRYSVPPPFRLGALGDGSPATVYGRVYYAESARSPAAPARPPWPASRRPTTARCRQCSND